MVRRPAIRRRPISPPRVTAGASTLPPPRMPLAQAPARPTLFLVVEDDAPTSVSASVARASSRRAMVGFGAALALVAATSAAWLTSRSEADQADTRSAHAAPPLPMATTTNAGSLAMLRKVPAAQEVPVVDVNSLPAAPRSAPPRATR